MNPDLQRDFMSKWEKYFGNADLPVAFYYTDDETGADLARAGHVNRCLIGNLAKVQRGTPMRFDADAVECFGGKRYCGFDPGLRPGFRYFLSTGIPGKIEGERYKKTPEMVDAILAASPRAPAPGRYLVLKRWDQLDATEDPIAVIFTATPDVLSGLYTLAGFDEVDGNAVISPFGAGCATILQYPMLEERSEHPRCVLGNFDVSARPFLPANALTFAVPMKKLVTMVANMDESFLVTESWAKVRKRMGKGAAG